MAYAVEMCFDHPADIAVRNLWHAIERAGAPTHMINGVWRPHVTLGVAGSIDEPMLLAALRDFAHTMPALTLSFEHVGSFNTAEGVIFLAPVVTAHLLHMHEQFHDVFAHHSQDRWAYYLPGKWVPHCTLGHGLAAEHMDIAQRVARTLQLPLRAQVHELTLMEVATAHPREIATFMVG